MILLFFFISVVFFLRLIVSDKAFSNELYKQLNKVNELQIEKLELRKQLIEAKADLNLTKGLT